MSLKSPALLGLATCTRPVSTFQAVDLAYISYASRKHGGTQREAMQPHLGHIVDSPVITRQDLPGVNRSFPPDIYFNLGKSRKLRRVAHIFLGHPFFGLRL